MNGLDLNLVRVFVAVYEAGSVTLAAERLGITQPTVSYGIGKLREAYGDRLFVRHARGLVATPAAEQIYPHLSQALAHMNASMDGAHHFDPRTATRRFRISTSDIGALCFGPALFAQLQRSAPNVQLDIVPMAPDRLVDDLSSGRLDAFVGHLPGTQWHTRSDYLYAERYVCLLSEHHPSIGGQVDLAEFAASRHVVVTSAFSGHPMVENALVEQGLSEQIAIRVSQFAVVPWLVAQSDLIAAMPSMAAKLFKVQAPVRWIELPIHIPGFEVRLHWHPRHETNAGLVWLRGEIEAAMQALSSSADDPAPR